VGKERVSIKKELDGGFGKKEEMTGKRHPG
jgi:hypothetical protein